jgi:hypothetical protein
MLNIPEILNLREVSFCLTLLLAFGIISPATATNQPHSAVAQ